jgi:hypothetical protein
MGGGRSPDEQGIRILAEGGAGWRGDADGDDIEEFLAEDGSRAKVTAKPGTPRLDHADWEKPQVGSDRIA